MNLRCIYCQTPFTLNRVEMLNAIVTMNEKGHTHYDAHCPRCRRANSISRQRMELFYPNWREEAAKQKPAGAEPATVPLPVVKEDARASAFLKTEPLSKAAKATAEKKAAAAPPSKGKKTAAKKPADKPAVKKPAAPKKPAAKKPAASSSSKGKKPAPKTAAKKTASAKKK